ncbi:glycosyltransferase family protein [Allokutzneria albata]|uniref:Glycosyl transferase family 2 n=1 Tax=Allokutzneria albata TaxID=211114 RepID=A0A1G9SEX4_ALLAB|nr:hypothetical protein [Allokutzneria albata]SDM34034.1 hypothetical protein SAMN04489726_1124 [Allokutzneria albata]
MGTVAIVIPYFNPVGYRSHPLKLARSIEAFRRAGLADDVYLAGAGAPRPPGAKIAFWDEACAFMWHKERLINLAARWLPARYSHIVWSDSDVLVEADWAAAVTHAFTRAPLIQCFRTSRYRTSSGTSAKTYAGALSFTPGAGTGYAPGFCWGAHRSLFTDGPGLFDLGLVGGGDSLFTLGAVGHLPIPAQAEILSTRSTLERDWSPQLYARFLHWQHEVRRWVADVEPAEADTQVEIVQHGPPAARNYFNRHALLSTLDPEVHLINERDRTLRWSPRGHNEIEPSIRAYFHGRDEDREEDRPRATKPC